MEPPSLGGARGVFEIFVPGVFLLLNVALITYVTPGLPEAQARAKYCVEKGGLGIIVTGVFGYLFGMLLRLGRCEAVDQLSAKWARVFNRRAESTPLGRLPFLRTVPTRIFEEFLHPLVTRAFWFDAPSGRRTIARSGCYELWATEPFPYFGWLGAVANQLEGTRCPRLAEA
jgi:hypothetical protein